MTLPVRGIAAISLVCALPAASPAATPATPREMLLRAAFTAPDKPAALALINDAYGQTKMMLAATPGNEEARLQQALAIGYRGQLTRSLGDAKAARGALETLANTDPRNPEVETALAGWHLTAVGDLGGFLAKSVLGASKTTGLAMLDRAVALGGNRAFFPGYAALIRIRLDPGDRAAALSLAQRAAAAPAPTAMDRVLQRAAQKVVVPLQAGDGDAASKLAKQLLPFGQLR